jgi:hypothetical protein
MGTIMNLLVALKTVVLVVVALKAAPAAQHKG